MSDNQIVFKDCYTGKDFELQVVEFLRGMGFKADKTGRNDGGIDIVATKDVEGTEYKFYIQCKYFNTTLSKHPIQEVFAGANYYAETSGKGTPVVITNNRITREARLYAKRLGVEVIGDGEWKELSQVIKAGQVLNPNIHHGLFGIDCNRHLFGIYYLACNHVGTTDSSTNTSTYTVNSNLSN